MVLFMLRSDMQFPSLQTSELRLVQDDEERWCGCANEAGIFPGRQEQKEQSGVSGTDSQTRRLPEASPPPRGQRARSALRPDPDWGGRGGGDGALGQGLLSRRRL